MKVILSILDKDETLSVESVFRKLNEFDEIYVCSDVIVALSEVGKGSADIAVLDLALFRKNVMETLSCIKEVHDNNPYVRFVLLAENDDDVIVSAALRFGIDSVVIRPYESSDIANKVMELCASRFEERKETDPNRNVYVEKIVSAILSNTGILPNLKGYKYLKEAIISGYNDKSVLGAVTKTLYPSIAERNRATTDRVERAMRHAINTAWTKCGGNNFYSRLGMEDVYGSKKPTNSEYIFAVIEYLDNNIY